MNIKEIIVVEGKSDTVAVKRATGADTIETNGSAIDDKTLIRIQHALETRGVIVFTDPISRVGAFVQSLKSVFQASSTLF